MSELDFPKQLLELGDKEGAIKELARLLRNNPRNIDAWLLLANALDDPSKKADCYRQILRLFPDNQIAQDGLRRLVIPSLRTVQYQDQDKWANVIKPEKSRIPPDNINQDNIVICPRCGARNLKTNKVCFMCSKLLSFNKPMQGSKTQISQPQTPISYVSNDVIKSTPSQNGVNFQPRFITALSGLGVITGTIFKWASIQRDTSLTSVEIQGTTPGLSLLPGILTFIVGLLILLISIFYRTRPGRSSAPISALIALLSIFTICYWSFISSASCIGFRECISPSGGGLLLSCLSLVVAFISGLIRNPRP